MQQLPSQRQSPWRAGERRLQEQVGVAERMEGQVHYPNPPAELPQDDGSVLICCAVPATGEPLQLEL
ncbi:hypothetical protein ACSVIJ_23255 [Pseudomonas sp. NCHU5208]|uniref:hypothetical protein n=1 Tax=unclassified Pseudomonas TaxID=196821 RepID=UPI003F9865E6